MEIERIVSDIKLLLHKKETIIFLGMIMVVRLYFKKKSYLFKNLLKNIL
jgi:hypothetical protein